MAQIVEMTWEELTGSLGVGKGGSEVSGHPVDRGLSNSLFFYCFVAQTGRTLAL